jgi:hypothetical protein
MGASTNHGNSVKDRKSSRPARFNQKPCRPMLTTSTSVVVTPPLLKLAITVLDDPKNLKDFALGDAVILRQFDARLKPDLQFPVGCFDVDVHAFLLPREEVEPVRPVAEHSRTHAQIVAFR